MKVNGSLERNNGIVFYSKIIKKLNKKVKKIVFWGILFETL